MIYSITTTLNKYKILIYGVSYIMQHLNAYLDKVMGQIKPIQNELYSTDNPSLTAIMVVRQSSTWDKLTQAAYGASDKRTSTSRFVEAIGKGIARVEFKELPLKEVLNKASIILTGIITNPSPLSKLYTDIRKAVKATYGDDNVKLNDMLKDQHVFRIPKEIQIYRQKQTNATIHRNNNLQIPIREAEMNRIVASIEGLPHPTIADNIILLQLATGSRMVETIISGFELKGNKLHITGIAKKKRGQKNTRTIIPVWLTPDECVDLHNAILTEVIAENGSKQLDNQQLASKYNGIVNQTTRRLLPKTLVQDLDNEGKVVSSNEKELTSHYLRAIAVAMAKVRQDPTNNMSATAFISEWLGHEELGTASIAYQKINIITLKQEQYEDYIKGGGGGNDNKALQYQAQTTEQLKTSVSQIQRKLETLTVELAKRNVDPPIQQPPQPPRTTRRRNA